MTARRAALAPLGACVAAAILGACAKSNSGGAADTALGAIVVHQDSVVLRRGPIGVKDKFEAAYVYVDVENKGTDDRVVAVEGDLQDAAGANLSKLAMDELVVPAHQVRTFALVGSSPEPTATKAAVRLRRNAAAEGALPVTVGDAKLEPWTDENGQVGRVARVPVTNPAGVQAVATVIVSEHDAAGKIVGRPFLIVTLDPHETRVFPLPATLDTASATPYVGTMTF